MGTEDADLAGRWMLTPVEHVLVMAKNRSQRLSFGLLLLFYRARGRFPKDPAEVAAAAVEG